VSNLENALNRLQRVGDQYSGTNQKLIQAVMEVAQAILTALPPIPTGYNGYGITARIQSGQAGSQYRQWLGKRLGMSGEAV